MTNSKSEIPYLDSADIISCLTEELVSNPDVLAAYGRKLDTMVHHESGFIQYLPRCVKRRLKALKKLQLDVFKVEEDFYRQVQEMEKNYSLLYQAIHCKRKEITTGAREPTEEECDYSSDEDDGSSASEPENFREGDTLDLKYKKRSKMEKKLDMSMTEKTKGFPNFWLTILKNVSLVNDLIQKHDEVVLSKLLDIRVEHFDKGSEIGFELVFDFGQNEYFEEKELRKKFILRYGPDPKEPMIYEGPEIVKSIPCQIHWKKDKNVTLKTKRVKKGSKRFVNKHFKIDSFFNFFCPFKTNNEEINEADQMREFEMAQLIKDNVVPKALLYYTGQMFKNEKDDDDGFSVSDEDDGDRRKRSKSSETDKETMTSSDDDGFSVSDEDDGDRRKRSKSSETDKETMTSSDD